MTAALPALPAPFAWEDGMIAARPPGAELRFTTRLGGVSDGPYAALNLGPWTDDDPADVRENRAIAAAAAGRPLAGVRQVHGTRVVAAEGPGGDGDGATEADAVVTDRPDLAPCVLVADCLPVLLATPRAVAAVHAGWRGLAGGIVGRAVAALRAHDPDGRLTAAIGPGARVCCYEVGDEVRDAFAAHGPAVRDGGHVDLPAIAGLELRAAGAAAVLDTGLCTLCGPEELLFSHRRAGGITGRQGGIAWRS